MRLTAFRAQSPLYRGAFIVFLVPIVLQGIMLVRQPPWVDLTPTSNDEEETLAEFPWPAVARRPVPRLPAGPSPSPNPTMEVRLPILLATSSDGRGALAHLSQSGETVSRTYRVGDTIGAVAIQAISAGA